MLLRFILVVALLCFLSPISYATPIERAKSICSDLADAGVTLTVEKEKGGAKHVYVERLYALYRSGQVDKHDAEAILWVIEFVYGSEETHETIRKPLLTACMKEFGFNDA